MDTRFPGGKRLENGLLREILHRMARQMTKRVAKTFRKLTCRSNGNMARDEGRRCDF
jgi:hypothetical protein